MRNLSDIVNIIESEAVTKYGSVSKMLQYSGVSKSMIDNMKRETPSIPSIDKFCKITDSLELSLDFLLNGSLPQTSYTNLNPELSVDEQTLVNVYRDIDKSGKVALQTSLHEIWANHRKKRGSSSNSSPSDMIG